MNEDHVDSFDALVRAGDAKRPALRSALQQLGGEFLYSRRDGRSLIADYLTEALYESNPSALRALLDAGLSPNLRPYGDSPDGDSADTLLSCAARSDESAAVEMLLGYGADPNQAGWKGWTPLMYAVALDTSGSLSPSTSARIVRLLLASGAQKGIRNDAGFTAEEILKAQHHFAPEEIEVVVRSLQER